ncbi:MAG: type II toxin-antitoxin system PemK/MazF family toxin [Saprospiraceae bacterium]|nr:type II toxin-antitoxin system PemK/MazF family toxin [Saprospiraceae bacterium]
MRQYCDNIFKKPTTANGLLHKSEILVFQIRSISKLRLVACLGQLTSKEMEKIEENFNKILKY